MLSGKLIIIIFLLLIFYGYDSWRQISVYNDRFVLIRKLQTNNATVEIKQRTKLGTPALSLGLVYTAIKLVLLKVILNKPPKTWSVSPFSKN